MKCKTGHKDKSGRCVKTKSYSKQEKKFWGRDLYISIFIFFVFSVVLFINNLTDLFRNYGWYAPINIITWIALVGAFMYTLYLKVWRDLL